MKRYLLLWILWSVLLASPVLGQQHYPFQNTKLPVEKRVDDLLGRLTLKEKTSLLLYKNPAIPRLGIPAYVWWNEALHGVARAGKATVFPQSIGLAATFDTALLHKVAVAISDEARAKHAAAVAKNSRVQYTGLTFWAPNINIFRDPRWGRGQETYGEDPFLTASMGVAYVKGMQGSNPRFLKTSVCAKHFAAYSGPEAVRHHFDALPDEVDLHETYFPAFKTLVQHGVDAVMCAYNRLDNSPCCGSRYLLDTVLRQDWGFRGHVVTDCWALDDIWARHKVVDNRLDAAVMAAKAGANLNCGYLYKYLPEAVQKGLLTEKRIDTLLKPLLRTRFKLGLMGNDTENPYATIRMDSVAWKKHRVLARRTAAESIVLLKNKDHVLPLDHKKLKKIFVTGPAAADMHVLMGNYSGISGNMKTLLEGIVQKAGTGTVVNYTQGAFWNGADRFNGFWIAQQADAVIACVGYSPFLEGENGDALLNDDGGDRRVLHLPQNQIDFIRKLKKSIGDIPLVVVVTGGSAVAMPEIEKLADAILFVWYPGEEGGDAVADVLFGDYNPAGRLPVTFYKTVKDLPPFESYDMTGRTYRYFKGKPEFAFGYGLSYTTFRYSGLSVKKQGQKVMIRFTVTNSGNRRGDEVPQVYVREKSDSGRNPIKSLVAFTRCNLKPGEKKEITFSVPYKQLKHWDIRLHRFVLDSAVYIFQVAAASDDVRLSVPMTIP
ncbi:glycoside hydrolase family 3 C-terminal domain-containing protein [Candidatus Sulfidibacterium hydrothermale]|uniref:glycoside hydrolase family 3 C-terminal domain-containing protein n=1 Tax=Candidatus Sulfidibacterium hydrothermale TaxID=2875962 RepID=UPI001F0A6E0C|nr:glycoside hydrolase family 3 C-terminal domain-containing protein [Candidatus Sulfidibacterium hydrothermale]UBM61222.1 glycoside hydrolase family 3 C-terminal domain-containing protein [Candidatus Sulfidibacterium hydrothermale]